MEASQANEQEGLLRTLRAQHVGLIRLLAELRDSLMPGAADGIRRILAFQQPLMDHLMLEDTEFYPVMRQKLLEDPNLAGTLADFIQDLEMLREEAGRFFQLCESSKIFTADLKDGFSVLSRRLKERMEWEESLLYAIYCQTYDPGQTLH